MVDPDGDVRLIAQNLLDARHRKGLTLAQAAAENGVSVTHLSRLERGERNPSIGVLVQLARSYGLSLGALVGEEPPPACQVFRGAEVAVHDGPDYRYATLSGIDGENLLEAIRLELPVGVRTPRSAQHPGEEWVTVQVGRVRVEVGTQSVELGVGDALHFDAASPHQLHNLGDGLAVVLVVSAGSPGRHR